MDRDAFKKVCKGQWRNQDEHGYVFLNTKKPAEMSNDWNNILKRNKEYIQAKNKVKTQVEIIRLQQLGLTENLQTQPILKSQEDIKKRLIPPKEPIRPVEPHHPEPNPYGVETYLNKVIPDEEESDDYAEDYPPIIQEIDDLDDMVASGQGITFLFDNNDELLNRLRVILAAMKEGHRSHRQYNEVNCILKRLLGKGIIDKNDYKSVIENVK
ncbi:hypothetical protein LOTGIDRAFT_165369 [Lottia gigantea]|uniref:Uncharacterized protein n=1 Tax=Lottia gigantea TaxID=225164 RepID=V4A5P4_LOTGI|nr:hypothetical protein LOTGIDRAFT_165369 [Lottia gigantea]ESO88586.1 hypothetical protein LOTGIDRAFT_165369 [Lottia gigantea]